MRNSEHAEGIRQRHRSLSPLLDERQLRLWAASEAKAVGYGGISLVAKISGLARSTIHTGLAELETPSEPDRIRKAGAGRKKLTETQPELLAALDELVDPVTRGDPESRLRWVCKSLRRLESELKRQGFEVSVGIDHDTAAFATATIGRWWWRMGRPLYPEATELLITADGGGSNGTRLRIWKVELQKLADRLKMTLRVCHFPPGTSKWNKIEHRLFSHISINWRGQPLTSIDLVVRLIGATTTKTGLVVKADIDRDKYPLGISVSDAELAGVRYVPDAFHGEWNYRIKPRSKL